MEDGLPDGIRTETFKERVHRIFSELGGGALARDNDFWSSPRALVARKAVDEAQYEQMDEIHEMLRKLVQGQSAHLGLGIERRLLHHILLLPEPDSRSLWILVEDGERKNGRSITVCTLGDMKTLAHMALRLLPVETDTPRQSAIDVEAGQAATRQFVSRNQVFADVVKRDVLSQVSRAWMNAMAANPDSQPRPRPTEMLFTQALNLMCQEPYRPTERVNGAG